jgi:hypothetical protein
MSHKCKDGETKKLAKAIFQTIDFIESDYYIDCGCFIDYNWPNHSYRYQPSESRSLIDLPIVVILYLITRDEKYLKPSRYVKGTMTFRGQTRNYIKFSNNVYMIDSMHKKTFYKTEDVYV